MATFVTVRRMSARFSLLQSRACWMLLSGTLTSVCAATASRPATFAASRCSGLVSPDRSACAACAPPSWEPAPPSHSVRPLAGTGRLQLSSPPWPLLPNVACWSAGVGPQNPGPVLILAGEGLAPTLAYQDVCCWLKVSTSLEAETVLGLLNWSNV